MRSHQGRSDTLAANSFRIATSLIDKEYVTHPLFSASENTEYNTEKAGIDLYKDSRWINEQPAERALLFHIHDPLPCLQLEGKRLGGVGRTGGRQTLADQIGWIIGLRNIPVKTGSCFFFQHLQVQLRSCLRIRSEGFSQDLQKAL